MTHSCWTLMLINTRSYDWDDKAKAGQSQWHLFKSLGSLEMSQARRINYCTMHDTQSHHAGIWARLIWQDQSGGTILEPGAAVALHKLQNINAWWETIGFLSLCAQWHRCFTQALLFIYCLIVQILDIDFLNLYCGF